MRTGRRGRPVNTGRRDVSALVVMADALARGGAGTPTEAARGITDDRDSNGVKRRVAKFNKNPGLLADAVARLERRRASELKRVLMEARCFLGCLSLLADEPDDQACEQILLMQLRIDDDWVWAHPEVRKAVRRLVSDVRPLRFALQREREFARLQAHPSRPSEKTSYVGQLMTGFRHRARNGVAQA